MDCFFLYISIYKKTNWNYCMNCSFFVFIYTNIQFEIYTNSSVKECFKFENLKRVKKNLFRTINLCKIKTNIQTCEEENKKYWVLKKLPLLMLQREKEGGKEKTFIYILFWQLGCISEKIKIYSSTWIYGWEVIVTVL